MKNMKIAALMVMGLSVTLGGAMPAKATDKVDMANIDMTHPFETLGCEIELSFGVSNYLRRQHEADKELVMPGAAMHMFIDALDETDLELVKKYNGLARSEAKVKTEAGSAELQNINALFYARTKDKLAKAGATYKTELRIFVSPENGIQLEAGDMKNEQAIRLSGYAKANSENTSHVFQSLRDLRIFDDSGTCKSWACLEKQTGKVQYGSDERTFLAQHENIREACLTPFWMRSAVAKMNLAGIQNLGHASMSGSAYGSGLTYVPDWATDSISVEPKFQGILLPYAPLNQTPGNIGVLVNKDGCKEQIR